MLAYRTMRGRAQCGLLLLAALGAAGLVEDPAPSPDDATVHSGGTAAARTGTRARDADHGLQTSTSVGAQRSRAAAEGGLLSATFCAKMNATAHPLTMTTRSFARTES